MTDEPEALHAPVALPMPEQPLGTDNSSLEQSAPLETDAFEDVNRNEQVLKIACQFETNPGRAP